MDVLGLVWRIKWMKHEEEWTGRERKMKLDFLCAKEERETV